jgi:hypothetical protein
MCTLALLLAPLLFSSFCSGPGPEPSSQEAERYARSVYIAAMAHLAEHISATVPDVAADDCVDGYVAGVYKVDAPSDLIKVCRVIAGSRYSIVVEVETLEGAMVIAPPPDRVTDSILGDYAREIFVVAHAYLARDIAVQPADILTEDCTRGYARGGLEASRPPVPLTACRVALDGDRNIRIELVGMDGQSATFP